MQGIIGQRVRLQVVQDLAKGADAYRALSVRRESYHQQLLAQEEAKKAAEAALAAAQQTKLAIERVEDSSLKAVRDSSSLLVAPPGLVEGIVIPEGQEEAAAAAKEKEKQRSKKELPSYSEDTNEIIATSHTEGSAMETQVYKDRIMELFKKHRTQWEEKEKKERIEAQKGKEYEFYKRCCNVFHVTMKPRVNIVIRKVTQEEDLKEKEEESKSIVMESPKQEVVSEAAAAEEKEKEKEAEKALKRLIGY